MDLKHLVKLGESLTKKSTEILKKHEQTTEKVSMELVDALIVDAGFLGELVDDLYECGKVLNKAIMSLEQKGGSILKALERDKYQSPHGSIEVSGKWAVRMPKDDESKMELFTYLKAKKVFERYATVNVRSLNSFYMAEWEAAKKKDPDAWMTFRMPGIPEPVFDEYTKIKGIKQRKRREEENDNE